MEIRLQALELFFNERRQRLRLTLWRLWAHAMLRHRNSELDGHTHVCTSMTSECRILIASRKSGIAWGSHLKLARAAHWRVVGIVDPRAKAAFDDGCAAADVVLIEAEDLIWLLDHRPALTRTAFRQSPPMVLLDEGDMLEIVTRGERAWGLLLQQYLATMSVERLALACAGYLVMNMKLVQHLRQDGLRLDIVGTLSPDELCVLTHLGAALSNRDIAEITGLFESRVKAATRTLARKLHLKNRTALAVFAVENETLLSLAAENALNAQHL